MIVSLLKLLVFIGDVVLLLLLLLSIVIIDIGEIFYIFTTADTMVWFIKVLSYW